MYGYPIPEGFPTVWEVCYQCRGSGTSSAYLGAFTSDEMYEMGDEFREQYMDGFYDRVCDVCDGRTTVKMIDDDRLTDEQAKELDALVRCYEMEANERRQGA